MGDWLSCLLLWELALVRKVFRLRLKLYFCAMTRTYFSNYGRGSLVITAGYNDKRGLTIESICSLYILELSIALSIPILSNSTTTLLYIFLYILLSICSSFLIYSIGQFLGYGGS